MDATEAGTVTMKRLDVVRETPKIGWPAECAVERPTLAKSCNLDARRDTERVILVLCAYL